MNKRTLVISLLIVMATLLCALMWLKFKRNSNIESYSNQKCVVYVMDKYVGFFSDFGFLTEAYIRSKRVGMPFYVDSSQWSYKHTKGWHDYFQSLSEVPPNISQSNIIYCKHQNSGQEYVENIKQIDNNGKTTLRDYELAIRELFVLNADIELQAMQRIKSYGGDYEAIYIRRGDKIAPKDAAQIESPTKSTKEILDQCNFTKSLPLYVQSDDYTEIKNIKSILNKDVFSTTPENKLGSHESERQTMNIQQKQDEMNNFFIGVYICCKAKKCFVDSLSNVSRFIKLYSPSTVEFYKLGNEIPNYYSDKELNKNVAYGF
jgi:hypothetical protein